MRRVGERFPDGPVSAQHGRHLGDTLPYADARQPADWPWPEFVVVLALFFAGWQRFLVEFLRAAPALIGPFHLGHLLSGLMILGTALIVAVRRKRVEQGDLAGMPQLRQQRLR